MKTLARFRMAGIGIVVTLVALLLAVLPASAAVTFHETIPTGYPIYNSCAGEFVDLSGNIDELDTTTLDSNGGVHVTVQTNFARV